MNKLDPVDVLCITVLLVLLLFSLLCDRRWQDFCTTLYTAGILTTSPKRTCIYVLSLLKKKQKNLTTCLYNNLYPFYALRSLKIVQFSTHAFGRGLLHLWVLQGTAVTIWKKQIKFAWKWKVFPKIIDKKGVNLICFNFNFIHLIFWDFFLKKW